MSNHRRAAAVLLVTAGSAVCAHAQTGILYKVDGSSTLRQDRCLGPCACPPHTVTGPLGGTFTLTPLEVGPLFTTYRISGVDWVSQLWTEPVSIRGEGMYAIGGEVGLTHRMDLVLVSTSPLVTEAVPYGSGLVAVNPKRPFPRIAITIQAPEQGCFQNTIQLEATPVPCQADCDASGGLTANDFQCFVNKFAAGDPYANCDGSTGSPPLTGNDFQCYMNRFAEGCP